MSDTDQVRQAVQPEAETEWRLKYRIPVGSDEKQKRHEAYLDAIEAVFAATETLFQPTELEYYGAGSVERERIHGRAGLSVDDAHTLLDGKPVYPFTIRGRTAVRLGDQRWWVGTAESMPPEDDRSSQADPATEDDRTIETARNLLEVGFEQHDLALPTYETIIKLSIRSGLFFAETELGATNRERLAEALHGIYDALPVGSVRWNDEGRPWSTVLEHRELDIERRLAVDWIGGNTTVTVEDGTVTVAVGPGYDQQPFATERSLQRWVELYVHSETSLEAGSTVVVRMPSETRLTGEVSRNGIDWE